MALSEAIIEGPKLVLAARHAARAGEREIGGKAQGLVRLASAGARVPAWFSIRASAFTAHIERSLLAERLRTELARLARVDPRSSSGLRAVEDVGAVLRSAVEDIALDEGLTTEVTHALLELGAGPFAVRSSLVGEDSSAQSFAGQFDTFLFQQSLADVLAAVRRCWASAFSSRSLAYRLSTGVPLETCEMAVVVQRMVAGDVSGVMFTANPLNGHRDEVLVTACWGLGEGIVGGVCNTDEYVMSHAGDELRAKLTDKDVAVVAHPSGTGTTEAEVATERRHVRCLAPAEATAISQEGARLAAAFGFPLDIEWTLKGGVLSVLQARPITSLPVPANADGPKVVWDNSNIQESYCGVTTPLTFSFANRAYASVYEQILRILGVDESVIAEYRPYLRNLLGLVEGRVYYNLNNWYRLLLLSPSFDRNKEDMEKMMGLDSPVDFVQDKVLTWRQKLGQVPRMAKAAVRVARALGTLDASIATFHADFEAGLRKIDRASLPQRSFSELMATTEQLRGNVLERWQAPLVNDNAVMMSSGKLRRLLERVAPDRAKPLWNDLVAGEEGIESTEPTRLLLRMAQAAREDPSLAATLRTGSADQALSRLRVAHADFTAQLERYLERYGDRCMGELKLETRSLREDPSFVVQILRNYLERPDLRPDMLHAKELRARSEAERFVEGRLGPLARIRFRRAVAAVRKSVKARERMRLSRTRLFGVYRDVYRAVGLRLHEAGKLDTPEDVFYLTVEEIEAYHEGTAVTADLAPLARVRKAEFERYRASELPNRFETRGPVYHGNPLRPAAVSARNKAARLLQGTGCSRGVVEAELRVVLGPEDDLSVNGQILTTLRTDPGWAPLFPTASGILVERGSTLSHSAVLARELGLPAVVGVADLLKIVHSGERARLDGAAGTVERLDLP